MAQLIFIIVLGAILGSFLNALIYRDKENMPLSGRSICPKCKKTLSVLDLIPVFSYLFLLGKCSKCKRDIGIKYLFVELSAIGVFILSYVVYAEEIHLVIINALFLLFLIGIVARDIEDFIIPDTFSIILGIIAIFILVAEDRLIESILLGPLFALPFFLLWFISDGRWMGLGDAKMALSIGWVATANLVLIFFLSFFVGLIIVGLIYLLSIKERGKLTLKSEIPFAPSIVISFIVINYIDGLDMTLINILLL